MKTQTFINRIMSHFPKTSPLARDEVLAMLQSYNMHWSKCIIDRRDYDQCIIKLLHEPWYNEAECRELYCTEQEAKSLIKSNPMIFTSCEFFSFHLCNSMGLERCEPSELCQCAKWGWRFLHCVSGWTLLQCPEKFKNDMKIGPVRPSFWLKNELEGGWKKDENGLMVKLDFSCFIFDKLIFLIYGILLFIFLFS